MKKLLQVIYVSRSTFEATAPANNIEPNVARILAKSRINNRKNGLVGVLYFGDGVFFQCLEGEERAVNQLLVTLEQDVRHKDLKILSKKYIQQLSFADWSMKFAPLDVQITKFLKANGFQSFDPYVFSDAQTEQFLTVLFRAGDVNARDVNAGDANAGSTHIALDKHAQLSPAVDTKTTVESDFKAIRQKVNLALTCSVIALMVALIALFKP